MKTVPRLVSTAGALPHTAAPVKPGGAMKVFHFTCPVDRSSAMKKPRKVSGKPNRASSSSLDAAPMKTVLFTMVADWVRIG